MFWVTSEYLPLADIFLAGALVILPYGSPTPDTSIRSPRTSPTIDGRFSLLFSFCGLRHYPSVGSFLDSSRSLTFLFPSLQSFFLMIPLADKSVSLLGPFDLVASAPYGSAVTTRQSTRQWVPTALWHELCSICASRGILLPSISAQPVIRSRWTKTKKRKRSA